jgi:hypothetical protein
MSADCDTLVAFDGSQPVATGALRARTPEVGEIKRCIGGARGAQQRAFQVVRLHTNERLTEANRMYGAAGYWQIADYSGQSALGPLV